jgi:hypothetical protein
MGIAALVIGIVNASRGYVNQGISQIVLSIIAASLGLEVQQTINLMLNS